MAHSGACIYPPCERRVSREREESGRVALQLSNYLAYESDLISKIILKNFSSSFLERIARIAVTCSAYFFCERSGGRERKKGKKKSREKAGKLERREDVAGRRDNGRGNESEREEKKGGRSIVSPSGPQKSVVELEGCLSLIKISHNPFHVL